MALRVDELTLAFQRVDVKQRLLRTLRLFGALGYGEGVAGHATVQDPVDPDHYWVNSFKCDFTQITDAQLLLVAPSGAIVEGHGGLNPSVHPIHGELHKARLGASSFIHAHSFYGRTWSSLGRPLDPITQDACAIYDRHGVYGEFTGLITDEAEGRAIARVLGSGIGVILQNHGHLTCGRSVEEAGWWFVVMERASHSQLLAEAAGTPIRIDDTVALECAAVLSEPGLAERQFLNLCDAVLGPGPAAP